MQAAEEVGRSSVFSQDRKAGEAQAHRKSEQPPGSLAITVSP